MSHIVSKKRNIRTIKALRGETLTIDLGRAQTGTLKAWMKKDPNDTTYRSFDIQDNRYLILPKDKTQDYYHAETQELLESIKGRWYFDVRRTPESGVEADDEVIYTGTILFENQVTDSNGVEITDPTSAGGVAQFINLTDTPDEFGESGQTLIVNETGDGLVFGEAKSNILYSLKDTTLLMLNLDTIYNGTTGYGESREAPLNVFIEIPDSQTKPLFIRGRLNVGSTKIQDSPVIFNMIASRVIEFQTNLLSTADFNNDFLKSESFPVVSISKISTDLFDLDNSAYSGQQLEDNIETFIEDQILDITPQVTAKFGNATIGGGIKRGLLITLSGHEVVNTENGFFANLLELVVTYNSLDDVEETDFLEQGEYLSMLSSSEYASFISYETLDAHTRNGGGMNF